MLDMVTNCSADYLNTKSDNKYQEDVAAPE